MSNALICQNDLRRGIAGAAVSKWPTNEVTASFMPDGTLTDTGTPSNLYASLGRHLTRPQWQNAYDHALMAWSDASALELEWVPNGDIRFGGRSMQAGQLGWTYSPGEGDIAGDCFLGTQQEYFPADLPMLLAVLLHEIGHSLGLDHSTVQDAVMYPMLNIRSTLAPDDIRRIQALYGSPPQPNPLPVAPDRFEPNNSPTTARGMGVLTLPWHLTGLTLHSERDEDWYSFRVPATGNYIVTASFEEVDIPLGKTFFLAVFNNDLARLGRGSTSSSTGKGAVTGTVRLAAGQRYYLRVLSPSGGLFRYSLAMARAS